MRVCAQCEYIFLNETDCPKCGFTTYDAFWVYAGFWETIWNWITQKRFKDKNK